MVPTPRALVLDNEVRQILATMERISSPVQSFNPISSKFTFKLVATGYVENMFLGKVMAAIAARAPGIQVEVRPPDRFHDTSAGKGRDRFSRWLDRDAHSNIALSPALHRQVGLHSSRRTS
jgi:DNA-binding transcriptional LysR family regulator